MRDKLLNYKYFLLKCLININSSSFIRENSDTFLDYVLEMQDNSISYIENGYLDNDFVSLDEEKIISLVREVLLEIDPSCNLFNFFNSSLANGVIDITTEEERCSGIKRALKDDFCVIEGNGEYIVNCPIKEEISDVSAIVHEFIHYYSIVNISEDCRGFNYFLEMASMYFEKYVAEFLVRKGFDKRHAYYDFYDRVYSFTMGNISNCVLLDLESTMNRDGIISSKNILSNKKTDLIFKNYSKLMGYRIMPRIHILNSDFFGNKNYSSFRNRRSWLKLGIDVCKNRGEGNDYYWAYLLGSYFALKLDTDRETINMVLDLAKNNLGTEYHDEDIFNKLKKKIRTGHKQKVL